MSSRFLGRCIPHSFPPPFLVAPGLTHSINRTAKIKNLEENLEALKITLTPEENKEIRKASEAAEVFGERCPPRLVSFFVLFLPPPPPLPV